MNRYTELYAVRTQEPMAWMGIVGNYEVVGKLACPCGYKLGGYPLSVDLDAPRI